MITKLLKKKRKQLSKVTKCWKIKTLSSPNSSCGPQNTYHYFSSINITKGTKTLSSTLVGSSPTSNKSNTHLGITQDNPYPVSFSVSYFELKFKSCFSERKHGQGIEEFDKLLYILVESTLSTSSKKWLDPANCVCLNLAMPGE
jgi:hypothetical protein